MLVAGAFVLELVDFFHFAFEVLPLPTNFLEICLFFLLGDNLRVPVPHFKFLKLKLSALRLLVVLLLEHDLLVKLSLNLENFTLGLPQFCVE